MPSSRAGSGQRRPDRAQSSGTRIGLLHVGRRSPRQAGGTHRHEQGSADQLTLAAGESEKVGTEEGGARLTTRGGAPRKRSVLAPRRGLRHHHHGRRGRLERRKLGSAPVLVDERPLFARQRAAALRRGGAPARRGSAVLGLVAARSLHLVAVLLMLLGRLAAGHRAGGCRIGLRHRSKQQDQKEARRTGKPHPPVRLRGQPAERCMTVSSANSHCLYTRLYLSTNMQPRLFHLATEHPGGQFRRLPEGVGSAATSNYPLKCSRAPNR